MTEDNIVHFSPRQDFNDAPAAEDPFGVEPDPVQIATFLDVVFGWCEGQIPVRGFVDMGQGKEGRPHNVWIDADAAAPGKLATFANWAWREGAAVYVIPGTVAGPGQAKAAEVLQMQALVVDLDAGDIPAKLAHLLRHLGQPTLIIESGGRTSEGAAKLHIWWKMTEPAEGAALASLCRLRGEIALKVGGDTHFRSAHQPIRVAGTVYHKHGNQRLVQIREHHSVEVDLDEFAERVAEMPPLPGAGMVASGSVSPDKPRLDDVLVTPVREGGQDDWSRFEGASAAIGHFIRMVHEGRMSKDEGWQAICGYNAAMLRPSWPIERLQRESERLWDLHVQKNGPPLVRLDSAAPAPSEMPTFTLGALLDDTSPMPEDIIAPRVLTPGGMLVLGGAPKVGKSDLTISWLVHMAAGQPFLGFTPPRPLRVFYLQAEIQYHYLRERLGQIALPAKMLAAARDTFVATPKLKMLLDTEGSMRVARAIQAAFPDAGPDIICIDPIRNLFDGGLGGGGENDNTAMMFFLKDRVEVLRDYINPACGVILVHHTRKLSKQQLKDDPFLALSGASALRGFYTSGLILHRPDEDAPERKLEIELRNGPALPSKLIDKVGGQWVEINPMNERLVRAEVGAKYDAERLRKQEVILSILLEEAAEGRLYTANQFAEVFENKGGLGGKDAIRDRIAVQATKGTIKFVRNAAPYGLGPSRSRFGYLCVEGMVMPTGAEEVDPDTGEVSPARVAVLPTSTNLPRSGLISGDDDGLTDFDGATEILRTWGAGLTPDPDLTVSQWADRHRMLSGRASAEPGRYRTGRTPYMREIMDRLSPGDPTQRVVFMKAAQVGATEAGNNWIGFAIHQAPGPMLAVQPTVELAKRNSRQRIDPLIDESPELRERVKPARSRDAGNTMLSKEFAGGILIMTGANSAVGLRSTPARYIFLDEVDAYPASADEEGDPVTLAEARSLTFAHRRKVLLVSTPTIRGLSRIEREFEASDQRRYFVPCPHCGAMQWLKFDRLRWQKGKPETAEYHCEGCETPIAEHHKTAMLEGGEWRATATAADPTTVGYHLSALYSPIGWLSWERIVRAWDAAQGSDEAIKAFRNTILGETWVETGEAPDWQRLYDRRERWTSGTVPAGGLFLTAGADVQKDRIEVDVWAWGRGLESWLVDHLVIEGGPDRHDAWSELTALLDRSWPHERGAHLRIARLAIDTGYEAPAVYAWSRKVGFAQVAPVKGVEGFNRSSPVSGPTFVDATEGGKRLRRGARLWTVAVSTFKAETYRFLRLARPTEEEMADGAAFPPGSVHLPHWVENEWLKQFVAEQLVTVRTKRGFARLEWQKLRERNEALDCRVYARAAAWIAGADRWPDEKWRDLEDQLGAAPTDTDPAGQINRPGQAPQGKRRSDWLGRRGGWF